MDPRQNYTPFMHLLKAVFFIFPLLLLYVLTGVSIFKSCHSECLVKNRGVEHMSAIVIHVHPLASVKTLLNLDQS